jgi:Tfp pilus assembly protein PilP
MRTVMQWFAGVAVVVSIMASLQVAVGNPGKTANTGRLVSPPQVRTDRVPSHASRQLVVVQQTDETQPPYRYDAKGRRDPFESLVKEKPPVAEAGPVIDHGRPRGPLERFDLSSLKLMGIIWGELGRRAIIRAPDGKGYFVTVGMYMGQNGGQIVTIEDDRLVIKEKHRNLEGKTFDKTLTIPLRRKERQRG